jgi:hypothetical protein
MQTLSLKFSFQSLSHAKPYIFLLVAHQSIHADLIFLFYLCFIYACMHLATCAPILDCASIRVIF